jgi:glutathione S-transferase
MKLIGSNTSPYVRKVRIVMAEKKLDYQYVLEDVWGNDNMLKSNPLGKVPCLVVEGVEAIFDSRVIVEYVDTLSPVGRRSRRPDASASRCAPGRRWPTARSMRPSPRDSKPTGGRAATRVRRPGSIAT